MAQRWSESDPYSKLPATIGDAGDAGAAFLVETDTPERKGKKNGSRGALRGTRAGDTNSDKTGKAEEETRGARRQAHVARLETSDNE